MDNIKDVEQRDANAPLLKQGALRTHPFGHNAIARKLYIQAERVAAALYLVTNHVSSEEPLRISLRTTALQLLGAILDARSEMRSEQSETQNEIKSLVLKLISNVRLLSIAGRLSSENAGILTTALDDLGAYMQSSRRTSLSEHVVLKHEYFTDTDIETIASKGQKRQLIKDTTSSPTKTPAAKRADRVHSRKDSILETLRTQGQLGIKDIASHLPEYSEKMIQRELKTLVAAGRVTKSGAKRWSLYKLAS